MVKQMEMSRITKPHRDLLDGGYLLYYLDGDDEFCAMLGAGFANKVIS